MIGAVVVSHGRIGVEMVRVVRSIVKEPGAGLPCGGAPWLRLAAVALDHDEDTARIREKIGGAIGEVDQGGGVLLLTDMFGGTPSNVCLSFLSEGKVEVITGVNLPMLIKLASLCEDQPLSVVAPFIRDYGQKNIALAGEILKGTESP